MYHALYQWMVFFSPAAQSEEDRTVTLLVDGDESTLEFRDNSDFEDEFDCFSLDGYVVVYSLTDKSSFDSAVEVLKSLRHEVGTDKAIILVANKADLVRNRKVNIEEGRTTADQFGCKYIETSAALNHHVDELLVGALKQILLKVHGKSEDQTFGQMLDSEAKDKTERKGSFKKTKQFLEKLFRRNARHKDKKCDNLLVG